MSVANPFSTLLNPQHVTARLAVLQPAATLDAPIELNLTEAVLGETSYECISYDRSIPATTTSPSSPSSPAAPKSVSVSVDGHPMSIPAALESALRTFRRKERPRTIWAGLLVGRTAEERSAQAGAMRLLLSNAERTLCWLGPDTADGETARAFETITEMARRFTAACTQIGIADDKGLSHTTVQHMVRVRELLHACPYDDLNSFDFKHWRRVYDVFAAGYWSCVHPIAEIVLARAPVVAQGRSSIRWHDFVAATRALPFYQAKFFGAPILPNVQRGIETANAIEIAERRRRLGESVELLPMIGTARGCSRTTKGADPRENVFAVVHIATPSGRTRFHAGVPLPLPSVDYSKSVEQVFADAARYSVLERQDLMLWSGERPPVAKRLKRLPSWVPDFSAVPPRNGVVANPNTGMRGWWEAIEPASARKLIRIEEEEEGGRYVMHLQARPLDRITYVSPVFHAGNCRRLLLSELNSLPSLSLPATSPYASESPAQRTERFWRTLILNVGSGEGADSAPLRSGAPMRDLASARAAASLGGSFDSVLAEESLLAALDCPTLAQLRTPENAERIRASPELGALVRRCGNGAAYEALLAKNAAGRRFFRTRDGRFGMSAVEDVACADSSLYEKEEDKAAAGGAATSRNSNSSSSGSTNANNVPPRPDFGHLMSDPMARAMLESFQQYLQQRDPTAARVTAQAIRGEFPSLPGEQTLARNDAGIREGDLVVACVGGFFPYVLRPYGSAPSPATPAAEAAVASTPQLANNEVDNGGNGGEEDSSTYEFVGDCYLHGAMDGEDFQRGFFGRRFFSVDTSKLADITIV
ncbi:hypothetical protein AAE478_010310 [Parahypoxylon ruwenzoriense]